MKHTLFVTSSRLGDAVLTTGVLHHLLKTEPDSRITVVCGDIPKSIFEGIDGVDWVITVKKRRFSLHWPLIAAKLGVLYWHRIVDFRASLLGFLPAKHRHIWRKDKTGMHKTEVNALLIGEREPLAPIIPVSKLEAEQAKALLEGASGPFLAIAPTTAGPGKKWHIENYTNLVKRLSANEGPLQNATVILFGGPGEEDQVSFFLKEFPQNKVINLVGKTSPLVAAHVISLCQLFIGNDSGLMHCSVAVNTPTVGLFGVGQPNVYGPWGENSLILLSDPPGTSIKRLTQIVLSETTISREALALEKVYAEVLIFINKLNNNKKSW